MNASEAETTKQLNEQQAQQARAVLVGIARRELVAHAIERDVKALVLNRLQEIIEGVDREGAQRAMSAMMKMTKLDIAALQKAYDGG